MGLLYNLFIFLYRAGIGLATFFGNSKAKQWIEGRKELWNELEKSFPIDSPILWVHSASAGEFEQAKPVIEALKKEYPTHKIAVTFFSPSGYTVGKKATLADYVFYLPLDTPKNAKRFLSVLQAQMVVFIKYDYWYHHLKEVHRQGIPLLLVSAIFRKNQVFFKWYGGFYKMMLHFFTHLFVQDESSKTLLAQHGITHASVSGDTRFDRVATIANNFTPIKELELFTANHKVVVAGSTWPEDESNLQSALADAKDVKLIVAPHEIHTDHIKSLQNLFTDSVLFSELKKERDNQKVSKPFYSKKVLIIDNFGMLSRLYTYADVTYIGGGFNKSGIHNTLEAAVWGKPVVWGPNFEKFREAKEIVAAGGGFTYSSTTDLKGILNLLLQDNEARIKAGAASRSYVLQNGGATQKIIHYIQENRLLTKP